MKKTLKLAVLLVAFSVFAIGASAFTVSNTGAPEAIGGLFMVNVLASQGGELAGSFTYSATGAEFAGITYGTGVIGQEFEGKAAVISLDIGSGDVIATLSFQVTAQNFSVTITGVDEFAGLSGTASGAIPEQTTLPPQTIIVTPEPTQPAETTAAPAEVTTTADETVKAGVAFAIVPALIAAAATVVSRKKK